MKTTLKKIVYAFLLLGFGYSTFAQVPSPASEQDHGIVLIGATAHIGTGDVIKNSAIAFNNGKIAFVGKADKLGNQFSGYEKIDVAGKEVYPGLIIMQSQLGLAEIGGVRATLDNNETGELNPSVRSCVAYNTDSEIIPVTRSNGVLLAQVIPQGGMICGLSSVMNLDAWNYEDALYKTDEGMWLNWPSYYSRRGYGSNRTLQENKSYADEVKKLEKIFSDAKVYKGTPANSKLTAMQGIFDGSTILYIQADYVKTIIESISFAKKMGVRKIVLAGADEDALMVKDFLKENEISVIVAQIHRLPKRKDSYTKAPYEMAARFKEAGILAALTYDNTSNSANLPFVAGTGVAYGLTKEEALQTVTLNPAKILGIEDRAGTLEVGKDAHVVVSDGDLLDMRTNKVTLAFINGRNIDLDNKHKKLYKKFATKYGQEITE
ncbi:amidohydrolase family protein [Maribellus comscasis]|uniref:Amidohydrolase family protein n=1 Tax=Maribellus comscasis TaxID=2681766 RepID=A0A6I6JXM8_9BACT|nr:amidohydrolase family protein [Maribellus comscasis]QGY43893.1 amidohydrolase family protein [Maribellus comscasis]